MMNKKIRYLEIGGFVHCSVLLIQNIVGLGVLIQAALFVYTSIRMLGFIKYFFSK